MLLKQVEADTLIALPKRFRDTSPLLLAPGVRYVRELDSPDPSEVFRLDVWRNTVNLARYRYQLRGRTVVVLLRLCVGRPHTNPDGTHFSGSHLHVYQEGYGDKVAFPIDSQEFTDLSDPARTLEQFCYRCSVVDKPPFHVPLGVVQS